MNEIELNQSTLAVIDAGAPLLTITNHDDFCMASEYLQQNKAQQKKIETYFDPEIDQAHKLHKGLCAKKNDALKPLKDRYDAVAKAGAVYTQEQERIRREAEAAAEAERQRQIQAAQAELVRESEKAEAAGNLDEAADLLDQVQDLPVAIPTQKVEKEIRTIRTGNGTTSWIKDIEVTADELKTMEIIKGILAGELPVGCVDIKTGPLKAFFRANKIESYAKWGITVKPINRPANR